ncbi:MAG TPA: DALR domain-containing protein, partial [Thermoplasmata archaeon]
GPIVDRAREKFFAAMDDDFSTGDAVFAVLELTEAVAEVDRLSKEEGHRLLSFYGDASRVLGVFEEARPH